MPVITLIVRIHLASNLEHPPLVRAKLLEGSKIYLRDRGTLSWFVMEDSKDERSFTIVERYEDEAALKVHIENPFYQHLRDFIMPLADMPLQVKKYVEFDHIMTSDVKGVL